LRRVTHNGHRVRWPFYVETQMTLFTALHNNGFEVTG